MGHIRNTGNNSVVFTFALVKLLIKLSGDQELRALHSALDWLDKFFDVTLFIGVLSFSCSWFGRSSGSNVNTCCTKDFVMKFLISSLYTSGNNKAIWLNEVRQDM